MTRLLAVLAEKVEGCCAPRRGPRTSWARELLPLFKALADDTRLEMLALLSSTKREELCACDIEKHFDLSQPTISHHLKVLREAGLVKAERRGTWVYYALDHAVLEKLAGFAAALRA